jgi:hypothetical protein
MRQPLAVVLSSFVWSTTAVAQSPWSVPVLETALNSTAADTGVNLSFDGLTLCFGSFRSGNWEIWTSTRSFPGGPWAPPVIVAELGDAAVEDQPFLTVGGVEIYFTSSRPGGAGGSDILRSTRASTSLPWDPPTWVTEINSSAADSAFSITADGLEAYFLTTGWGAPFAPQNAIFRATRTSPALPFGTPALVTELSNGNTHRDCEISFDGLTITYTEFISPRLKVLQATRPDRSTPFGPIVVLTEFDTTGTSQGVFSFSMSSSGDEAILAAGFASAAGGQEIMNTRRSVPYGVGCGGLAHTCTAPVLGAPWDLTTTNIDPLSPISITFFGTTQVSIPLAPFGAPGCTALVDNVVASPSSPNVGGSSLLSVPVPLDPALSGAVFNTVSLCLTLGNPLNIYLSNGMRSTLGF